MAYDKIVDGVQLDANLTSIANAIRGKNGASAQIPFPDGFVTAINMLESGGALTVNSTNLHDEATDIADTYIDNGNEKTFEGWTATDYIPVAANTIYAFNQPNESILKGMYCAKYSEDKQYVGRFSSGIVTFPNALMLLKNGTEGYIRLSGRNSTMTELQMYSCTGTLNGLPSI